MALSWPQDTSKETGLALSITATGRDLAGHGNSSAQASTSTSAYGFTRKHTAAGDDVAGPGDLNAPNMCPGLNKPCHQASFCVLLA